MKIIKEREDCIVLDAGDYIIKRAKSDTGLGEIQNCIRFIRALEDTDFVPKLLHVGSSEVHVEKIIEDEPLILADTSEFVSGQNSIRLGAIEILLELLSRNIFHGDLTEYNIKIRNNKPVIIDWGESRFGWETEPTKRAGIDADYLYPALLNFIPDTNRIIRRWLAIRREIKHLRGFGKFLDLGTLYGDFVAMARSEGFVAAGYDNNGFDTSGLEIAKHRWGKYGVRFEQSDLIDFDIKSDVMTLLSVWTYLERDYGFDKAFEFLKRVVANSSYLFFETHLQGDGFGPEFLKTDDDVKKLLIKAGASSVRPLITIDVAGRNASRTVWKVT